MNSEQVFTRIGARALSNKEIENTLPTYSRLMQQIEEIRANKSKAMAKSEQTTSNISILGPRGSGKSSVLKTLYSDLTNNKNNIVLSTIVPDNIESHISLMACILGRLKKCVDEIVQKQSTGPICPPQRHDLEKQYNNLMENYLRLQEPYQKISIQQYSTESEYLRTMKGVFEASDKFGEHFRTFVDQLLSYYQKNHSCEDVLLFIFIDDVDLSTSRCNDIVKSLLTYLSHPAVVTILAGDIDIFGEALTLNFLHQDSLVDANSIKENYTIAGTGDDENLLNRKKELAYEYLKKVMPPSYRHFVKTWTPENRGDFCPIGLLEDDNTAGDMRFEALLQKMENKNPLLQGYFSCNNPQERPLELYELFDKTPRGLINVYSILYRFSATDNHATFIEKIILETIVSSNYNLHSHQDFLFSECLSFGANADESRVCFDKFKDSLNTGTFEIEESIIIFIYLDFAARLLGDQNALESEFYNIAKKDILFTLYQSKLVLDETRKNAISSTRTQHPYILGGIELVCTHTLFTLPFPLAIRYMHKLVHRQKAELLEQPVKEDNILRVEYVVEFLETISEFYKSNKSKRINCLVQSPAMLSLLDYLLSQNKESFITENVYQGFVIHESSNSNPNRIISPLYKKYCTSGIEICDIENDPPNIVFFNKFKSESFIDAYCSTLPHSKRPDFHHKKCIEKIPLSDSTYNQSPSIFSLMLEYWFVLLENKSAIQKNPFYNYLIKNLYSRICHKDGSLMELEERCSDDLIEALISNAKEVEKAAERLEIIFAIDKSNAWGSSNGSDQQIESPIQLIKEYIVKQLISTESELLSELKKVDTSSSDLSTNVWIDISCIDEAYSNFQSSYKGTSLTLAKKCADLFKCVLEDSTVTSPQLILTSDYIFLCVVVDAFLQSRSWYSRKEVRNIREALKNATMYFNQDIPENLYLRYTFWFHCFCRYRMSEISNTAYSEIEKLYTYNSLRNDALIYKDEAAQAETLEALQAQTGLSIESINKIPELFK